MYASMTPKEEALWLVQRWSADHGLRLSLSAWQAIERDIINALERIRDETRGYSLSFGGFDQIVHVPSVSIINTRYPARVDTPPVSPDLCA